jgi:hypothetical protein
MACGSQGPRSSHHTRFGIEAPVRIAARRRQLSNLGAMSLEDPRVVAEIATLDDHVDGR